jgi:post-segregation antitoxin (ccd killing protein)
VEEHVLTTKSNVTIYINSELPILAHEMGLNISKTCENALKEAINRLSNSNAQNNPKGCTDGGAKVQWTGRDLNPRLPPCEGGDHTRLIYRPAQSRSENKLQLRNLELSVPRRNFTLLGYQRFFVCACSPSTTRQRLRVWL